MARSRTKQITLHFTQDTEHILEEYKRRAKEYFRTPEQEILYALTFIDRMTKSATEHDAPAPFMGEGDGRDITDEELRDMERRENEEADA